MAKKTDRIGKKLCSGCGAEKHATKDFYMSNSPFYKTDGRLPMCKECVMEMYSKLLSEHADERVALYRLTQMLDVYYAEKLVEVAYQQTNTGTAQNIATAYFQKINSLVQYRGKTSIGSDSIYTETTKDESKDENNNIETSLPKDEKTVTLDMIRRWGEGLPLGDYLFLERTYQEYTEAYECKTPAQRMNFQQIAKATLEGENARRSGNLAHFEKMVSLVSKLMSDSNIQPKQEANIGDEEGECFGVFIRKIENEMPIAEPQEDFKDVDGIAKYILDFFVKPFARVFDLADGEEEIELTEEFEKVVEEVEVENNGN